MGVNSEIYLCISKFIIRMKFWIFQIQRWNRRNHPTYDWHNFRLKIKNNQSLGIRCIHKFYDTLKKLKLEPGDSKLESRSWTSQWCT